MMKSLVLNSLLLRSLAFTVFTFTFVACASRSHQPLAPVNSDSAIVSGVEVKPEDPIAAVAVRIDAGTGCSGTIIAPRFVLTAAHCIAHAYRATITTADGTTTSSRAKFYVSPQFNEKVADNRSDIGVIEFEDEIGATKFATLADESTTPIDGAVGFIAGYGIPTVDGTTLDFGTLRSLPITVKNLTYSDSDVEVQEGATAGACHGDSGGPAYSIVDGNVVVWGTDVINSRNATHDCLDLELYSRVSSFKPWIESVLAGHETPVARSLISILTGN